MPVENAVAPDEIAVDRSKMKVSQTDVAIEIVNMHKWYGDFHVLKDINLAPHRAISTIAQWSASWRRGQLRVWQRFPVACP